MARERVQTLNKFFPDGRSDASNLMTYVGYRLATYSAFPHRTSLYATKLADAGFYYQGHDDELVCYACYLRHSGWTSVDNPLDIHRSKSPHCPHLYELSLARNLSSLSISNGLSTASNSSLTSVGHQNGFSEQGAPYSDHRLASGPEIPRESVFVDSNAAHPPAITQSRSAARNEIPDEQNVLTTGTRDVFPTYTLDLGGAVYPMYQDIPSRRRTFITWDETRAPTVNELVLCGLFYAGYADCTRCFYCGVGLKSWDANDNAWKEHAKWRPSCGYLKAVKGEAFINRMLSVNGQDAAENNESTHQEGNVTRFPHDDEEREHEQIINSWEIVNQQRNYLSPHITTATLTAADTSSPNPTTSQATPTLAISNTENGGVQNGLPAVKHDDDCDSERYQSALATNLKLSSRLQCKLCHKTPVDTIYLPCGHVISCEKCASAQRNCFLCQEIVRGTAKVYFN